MKFRTAKKRWNRWMRARRLRFKHQYCDKRYAEEAWSQNLWLDVPLNLYHAHACVTGRWDVLPQGYLLPAGLAQKYASRIARYKAHFRSRSGTDKSANSTAHDYNTLQ